MAYVIHYWEANQNNLGQIVGEAELRAIRLKSINEAYPLSLPHNHPSGTVLITVDRSDKQSSNEKIIWIKPGYKSPTI